MKIFVSWSGRRSLLVAMKLKELLPLILHGCEVWLSTEDIRKGAVWNLEIAGTLARFSAAIVCITSEALSSPWLHFEAGALSKPSGKGKKQFVCTFLIDGVAVDPRSPLAMFQATQAKRDDTHRMVRHLNETMARPISDEQLTKLFAAFWPELAHTIETARRKPRTRRQTVARG